MASLFSIPLRACVYSTDSPLAKDEKDSSQNQQKTHNVVPFELLLQVEDRKTAEDQKGDNLLDHLELSRCKLPMANTVGRHLKTVLQKGYQPAYNYSLPEWGIFELQMAIPSKRHEDIGDSEQDNGSHTLAWKDALHLGLFRKVRPSLRHLGDLPQKSLTLM